MQSQKLFPGLILTIALAAISCWLAGQSWFTHLGLSSLVVAIVLGIVIGNVWQPSSLQPGIQFAAKRLLRIAIILYGFRVSIQQLYVAGWQALLLTTIVVSSIMLMAVWVGKRWFKLPATLACLIGAGTAVCGAAAVLAVEDVIKSEPYQTSIAVGSVVLFGTLSMFIYPLLQTQYLHLTTTQYGAFAGASIHEVAQVVVAGMNVSLGAANIAVIIKMLRVLLLIPLLMLLAWLKPQAATTKKIIVPWFALGFAAMLVIHSVLPWSTAQVALINQVDLFLLTVAMGAIGLETKLAKIQTVGAKPFYLAIVLWLAVMVEVYGLVNILY